MKNYILKYWVLLILDILLSCVTAAIKILMPLLIGKAIDVMIGAGQVDFAVVSQYIVYLLICIGIFLVAQWLTTTLSNSIVYRMAKDIRDDLFTKVQQLPLSYLDTHLHGETINVVINDTEAFCDGILLVFNSLFSGIITIIGILFFMFRLNASIAWIVVVLTPISLLIARFIASRTHRFFTAQTRLKASQSALIDEYINNQKQVKGFNFADKAQDKFDQINTDLQNTATKAIFFSSLVNPTTRLINNIIYAIVGLIGAIMALKGSLTIGSLSVFLSYANEFGKPFNDISSVLSELESCRASGERIKAILNTPSEKSDAALKEMKSDNAKISFRNVDFSYVEGKPIIRKLNLDIRNGERIAMVGKTGCGKTTLINLLLRFYDIDSGDIRIDDTSIYDITRHSLRSHFGMVLQDSWIKQATVRENLMIGNPNVSEEEMIRICKITHCHEFIRRMKYKYDTPIDNSSLSAGQKQLLSIARVMIANPKILILDEATSNIDTRTEIHVQQALEALMKGKTSLVVAHRLSTIVNSDRIIFMDAGEITEMGTHEELLAKQGEYYTLYNSQFRKPE